MRKIILSLSVVALLASCVDKGAYTLQGTLSGKAETPDSTKVYLYEDSKTTVALDSTMIIGGKFEFKGSQLEPTIRFIGTKVAQQTPIKLPLVIEPGNILFEMSEGISVSGTPLNDIKKVYDDKGRDLAKQIREISTQMSTLEKDDPKREELSTMIKGMREGIPATLISFVKENINNPVGPLYLASNSYLLDLDQMKELIALVPESQKSTNHITALAAKIAAIESTQIGKKFVDIKGLTLDGVEASLSDYVGKGNVVLLDFWASWCGPCIAELPNVKKAYDKYRSKGFEIVGVSLDRTKEDWQAATDSHKIEWPQFSNLKFWDEPGAKAYGVASIPHTVLIDKDGIIIAKNLRGDAIEAKLEELLK